MCFIIFSYIYIYSQIETLFRLRSHHRQNYRSINSNNDVFCVKMMHFIHALTHDIPLNSMTYIRHMTTDYDARNTKLSFSRLCPSLPGSQRLQLITDIRKSVSS